MFKSTQPRTGTAPRVATRTCTASSQLQHETLLYAQIWCSVHLDPRRFWYFGADRVRNTKRDRDDYTT